MRGHIRDQRGIGGILGLVLGLAAMLILALLLMQASGLMGRKGAGERGSPIDQAQIAAARTELHSVRLALQAWHDDEGHFPSTSEINSLEDLRTVLAGRLFLSEEPAWTFVSYANPSADRYLMNVRARDGARTVLGFSETKGPEVLNP
jgi:hypothetical protein